MQSLVAAASILRRLKAPEEFDAVLAIGDECNRFSSLQNRCYDYALSLATNRYGKNSSETEQALSHIVSKVSEYSLTTDKITYVQQLRDMYQSKGDAKAVLTTLGILETAPMNNAEHEKFLKFKLKTQIAADPSNRLQISQTYQSLGVLYESMESLDPAIENYSIALKLLRECLPIGDNQIRTLANQLAELYEKTGKHEEARAIIEPSVDWDVDLCAAADAFRQDDFIEAQSRAQTAADECNKDPLAKVGYSNCLRACGAIQEALEHTEQARDFYDKAIEADRCKQPDSSIDIFIARWRKACLSWQSGDRNGAIKEGSDALKTVDPAGSDYGMPEFCAAPAYEGSESILLAAISSMPKESIKSLRPLAFKLAQANEPVLATRILIFCEQQLEPNSSSAPQSTLDLLAAQRREATADCLREMVDTHIREHLSAETDADTSASVIASFSKARAAEAQGDFNQALDFARQVEAKLNALPAPSTTRGYSLWLTGTIQSRKGDTQV
ncbi:MAG: hypothetical protein ACRD3W_19985, partial [Terriglobales bacterium]